MINIQMDILSSRQTRVFISKSSLIENFCFLHSEINMSLTRFLSFTRREGGWIAVTNLKNIHGFFGQVQASRVGIQISTLRASFKSKIDIAFRIIEAKYSFQRFFQGTLKVWAFSGEWNYRLRELFSKKFCSLKNEIVLSSTLP